MGRVSPGYLRTRICIDCSREDVIRKDSDAIRCQACACRIGLKKGRATRSESKNIKTCPGCRSQFYAPPTGRLYCSVGCLPKATKLERQCKFCETKFQINASILRTNASGNFCSRSCYNSFLCGTSDRVRGRGSRWHAIRREALRRAPFCAFCGPRTRLEVHHIIPYRLTRNNSQVNLIPLCAHHHKRVEFIFCQYEHDVGPQSEAEWNEVMILWRLRYVAMRRQVVHRLQSIQQGQK